MQDDPIGSSFDDFLNAEGIHEEVTERALKRVSKHIDDQQGFMSDEDFQRLKAGVKEMVGIELGKKKPKVVHHVYRS